MRTYTVGGIEMKLPIMLGAGVAKHPSQLRPYCRPDVPVGALETGSATPHYREGNLATPQQWPANWESFQELGFGLNAWGMPNAGFRDFAAALGRLDSPVPVILNIAGFGLRDYLTGVHLANLPQVDAITFNLGCPNAHEAKTVPIAYDLKSLEGILDVSHLAEKPVWIKLSPYLSPTELAELARRYPALDWSRVPTVEPDFLEKVLWLIVHSPCVRAVIFSNTVPNVIYRNEGGKPVTGPNDGQAGLSGPIVKEISLNRIRQASEILEYTHLDLIGCGGILTGDDAIEYFEAGAKGVQCVSGPSWYGDGPRFFHNLIADSPRLQEYLSQE